MLCFLKENVCAIVSIMIEGRENWFRPKRRGWGIQPVTLKGWMYSLGWTGLIIAPAIFLLKIRRPMFGLIWIATATAAFTVEVWLILRCLRKDKGSSARSL